MKMNEGIAEHLADYKRGDYSVVKFTQRAYCHPEPPVRLTAFAQGRLRRRGIPQSRNSSHKRSRNFSNKCELPRFARDDKRAWRVRKNRDCKNDPSLL